MTAWQTLLEQIYGYSTTQSLIPKIQALLAYWHTRISKRLPSALGPSDVMLISYGDQLRQDDAAPLATLGEFCARHLDGLINCLHILPFYPYSSDDGFAVIDFRQVDPLLGDWHDVVRFSGRFHLMFDGVINHASAKSAWFQDYLSGNPDVTDYFIEVRGDPDLSKVIRPRVLPLLTTFQSTFGEKKIWTTFSADQVDLNYRNPRVLLEIVDILLFYISQGAEFIRLDAIAYLWKEVGTNCLHLPQTHAVIQLLRSVLDEVAPHVRLITETNVPHEQNISYFGDGTNEAQLVYNFALPPLVLHTLYTSDAGVLTSWAAGLRLPSDKVTFFNFLASHDGIGLNPVRGLLPDSAIDQMVQRVLNSGGFVSYKQNADGSQSPYELNINYFDALSDQNDGEQIERQIGRFMAAQAILLSLLGMPGIYFHSLFGSRGWPQGVALTGMNRSINRQKLNKADLERDLADESSLRRKVFNRYSQLLRVRGSLPAFDPHGEQFVLEMDPAIFAVLRKSGSQQVLCLQNVSAISQPVSLISHSVDLLTGLPKDADFTLTAYQTCWLSMPEDVVFSLYEGLDRK